MPGELTKPALAELAEQGATADGDDTSSVAAAAMLAVDLAAEVIDFSKTRILAVCFEENGDVAVYSVPDEAAEAVKTALKGDGIEEGMLAAADMERAFSEADEAEESKHEAMRPSTVPPPPMKVPE